MSPDNISIAGGDAVPATESVKINGPPGTGKTTQGLRRVYELLDADEYDLWDVCWATYRRSLAKDVLGRLAEWGIIDRADLEDPLCGSTRHIATAHAVAYRISGSERFAQYDTVSWRHKQDFMLSEYNLPMSTDNQRTPDYGDLLFGVYYWLKSNERTMDGAHEAPGWGELQSNWSSAPGLQEFADDWEAYKDNNNLVDYFEYLEYVRDEGICPPTPVVVIDEYHDVYPLMHSVCKMWAEAADVAIVLGDPQQVVNAHEGASPEFFVGLDLPEVRLKKTWRVPETLWNAATDVLAGWHTPNSPEFDQSVEGVIDEVRGTKMDFNRDTGEWETPTSQYGTPDSLVADHADESMMFLARTRRQVEGINDTWDTAGVIYRSQVGGDWRDDDRRRHLFNALQRLRGVKAEYTDWQEHGVVWGETATDLDLDTSESPPQRMTASELAHILDYTAAKFIDGPRSVADDLANTMARINDRHYSIAELVPVVTDEFWEEMTRGAASATHLVQREGTSALDTDELYRALVRNDSPTFAIENQHPDLEADGDANHIDGDGLDDAPVSMTIHASKGSEADVAVIYDGITKRIREGIRSDPAVAANEARTWYVALTRASRKNIIVRDAFWWVESYLPPALHNPANTQ